MENGAADLADVIHRFTHAAMATEFAIALCGEEEPYAAQAAHAAFQLLDRIEAELSRHLSSSDLSRLNAAAPGEQVVLGEECFAVLQLAQELSHATGGAFDPAAGMFKERWLAAGGPWRFAGWMRWRRAPDGMKHLHLLPGSWQAWKEADFGLDLGAIGKGYAIDRMAELLAEWGFSHFILHGGASSVLARGRAPGRRGWPVTLRHPGRGEILARFDLCDTALGASGRAKGPHIIDPRTRRPVRRATAAWVAAPTAAAADAWSTALMVLSPDRAAALLEDHSELGALQIYGSGRREEIVRRNWPGDS